MSCTVTFPTGPALVALVDAAYGYTPASAGAVVMSNGASNAPGMFFEGDRDTGFYRPAPNTLAISAGNTNVASFAQSLVTVGAFSTDVATGYMGMGRTDPGYWIDFNKDYVDIASGHAKHFFHMYGEQTSGALNTTGEVTGFYAHLDGDVATMTAGKIVEALYPLRGNGTWNAAATCLDMRGVYAGARIQDTGRGLGDGVITYGYGGFFEAANETASTGTITNAYGVRAEVRNTEGGAMTNAFGLYSNVRNQTNGGGITTGFGAFLTMESAGIGIETYYGLYISSAVTASATRWAIYSASPAKSWHNGQFAIGKSANPDEAKLQVEDCSLASTALLRSTAPKFIGTTLRTVSNRAASSDFNLISAEVDDSVSAVSVFTVRGDGQTHAAQAAGIPAGGNTSVGFLATSIADFGVFFGSGEPTLPAAKGSLYLRSDGSSTSNRAYINTDGSTTWTALMTVT